LPPRRACALISTFINRPLDIAIIRDTVMYIVDSVAVYSILVMFAASDPVQVVGRFVSLELALLTLNIVPYTLHDTVPLARLLNSILFRL
jgi:hypothetical protein